MADKDYADRLVVGLDRYIPTKLARSLLLATAGTLISVAIFAHSIPDGEVLKLLNAIPLLKELTIAAAFAFPVSLALVFELAVIVNHDKHFPVFHSTNRNELMSFAWLYRNASSRHWIFLSFICAASFYAGFFVANP